MQTTISTFEEYKKLLEKRLTPERFAHSLNVAQYAVYLAEKYSCGKNKAYLAGLLHDVMKNASRDEQLAVLKKDNVSLTPCEYANRKLWHAMAGASFIKTEFSIEDADIINAIRYHTTGRAKMSLLEKIIYISDFNSEERTYNGVQTMRALAEESLESAMLFALRFCISDLTKKCIIIHPDSINCYNELLLNQKNGG
ncbi:MAG TPA: bis(5'-nucleosyl)-tetraphosphatase (symmetrical) YqeK [Clostridia bacterium]|nr:bis(5'-nucleosyl)-tetraphosphatase (symmetrical) YqeK [Clostridia bacterium]